MRLDFPESKSIYSLKSDLHDVHPPQGLSEARRGKEFFLDFSFTDPPRVHPFGGDGAYHK